MVRVENLKQLANGNDAAEAIAMAARLSYAAGRPVVFGIVMAGEQPETIRATVDGRKGPEKVGLKWERVELSRGG